MDIDTLKTQRAQLRGEIETLQKAQGRLAAAEVAQKEAAGAFDSLATEDGVKTLEWAAAGAVGPPPAPDMAARAIAAQALAQANAAAVAASAAGSGVGARIAELVAEVRAIDDDIEAAAIEQLTAEATNELPALHTIASEFAAGAARLGGLRMYLGQAVRSRSDRGDHAAATRWARRIAPVHEIRLPDVMPVNADVTKAVAVWAGKFEELSR
jgi:hypothetical protein